MKAKIIQTGINLQGLLASIIIPSLKEIDL